MKIIKNKNSLIEEVVLTENDSTIITNPEDVDTEVIADTIIAGVENESEGEIVLTDAEGQSAAEDVQEVAEKIKEVAYVPPASDNELTRALDRALERTLTQRKKNMSKGELPGSGLNVLISGLPGSGKTAIVKQWARKNNINLCYVDAKNNELDAFINGYTIRDTRYPDKNKVTKGTSDGLAQLERERSVLFLDELNRQNKKSIRASLLSLINEHAITGDNSNPEDTDGYHYFKNLLFTVACINPPLPTETGASDLDDAEDSRFAYKLDFDSNIETAKDFFSKYYKSHMNYIISKGQDYYLENKDEYEEHYLSESLALYIVNHEDFRFDTVEDLDDLRQEYQGKRYTLFCQRSLTMGIEESGGRVKDFLYWVRKYSKFRPAVIEMLEIILSMYSDPVIPNPFENTQADTVKPETESDDELDFNFDNIDEIEDDDSLFVSKSNNGTRIAISPTEVKNKITNFKFN